MEEQERTEQQEDDVEGHGKRKWMASEEPQAEEDEGDDVEAHAMRHRPTSL
jgi:hypothetical protein